MYDDLEQTLVRELDDVASRVVVPQLPVLPATSPRRSQWHAVAPMLVAAAVVVAVLATVALLAGPGADRGESVPAPIPTAPLDDGLVSRAMPEDPVAVDRDLYVGGEQVPGRWYTAQGRGTRWIGLREDGSWWWGHDARPQPIDGAMVQPPEMSASGGYLARVVNEPGSMMLVGADTEEGGEGLGGVELRGVDKDPAPHAIAVTDDGLVVSGGSDFQWLWRPLVDGETVDLSQTSPGQVVIGSTDAGLLVTQGEYGTHSGGIEGEPYLARISPDGVLTRLGAVPNHDFLEATDEWLAYVAPGTIGGEAFGASELHVQRRDGSGAGVLTAPEGWQFSAPGFRWESSDRLLALVITPDGGEGRLMRCRPDPASCVFVDLP